MKKLRSHSPYNARSRLYPYVTISLFLVVVGGCSLVQQPTIFPPAPAPSTQTPFSDYAIVVYAEAVKSQWGMKSLTDQTLALGGALSLAGLSTAALGVANAAQTKGILIGANALLVMMGIIKPTSRDQAYDTGAGLVLDAEGLYVVSLTSAGYCTIPTDRVTAAGALLYQQVNAAVKVTSSVISGLLPTIGDLQVLSKQLPVSAPAKMALKDAAPCK